MLITALEITYLLLPAIAANMIPVIAAYYNWLPSLNRPLDLGHELNGRRLLGAHKTVRGLLLGTIIGLVIGYIQYLLSGISFLQSISLIPYSNAIIALLAGATLAYAALIGDAAKSFFKRRLNIRPGESWIPFDQIDFVITSLIAASIFTNLTFLHLILAIFIFGTGSLITSYIGKKINFKNNI